ncbi:MAG TPA: SpoVG family protein [Tepidisphaeraceae bacterium]|jgi:stage V sporulation protein G|nr:SpoVG family protein [Tepidisphaeraceae bacterium]
MQLTEIRINLCGQRGSRLKAFCSLTFDDTFVIRDVKLIDGNDGLFLAMPSRKLSDHCPRCREKNHLRARYCNNCGTRLNEERHHQYRNGNGQNRLKLHADIAHPINAECRAGIERCVLAEYDRELERSRQPGYVPPSLDGEDFDFYDPASVQSAAPPMLEVRRMPSPVRDPAKQFRSVGATSTGIS